MADISGNHGAYLKGSDTATGTQLAYLAGGVADLQNAYLKGVDTTLDNQNAYLTGTLSGTIDVQISSDIDDAYTWEGVLRTDRAYVWINYASSSSIYFGLRFRNIPTPDQIITISAAYISLYTYTYDDPNFTIYGEDTNTPEAPESGTLLDNRTLTTASTPWSAVNIGSAWHNSPSIIAIIQEIIDLPAWTSGDDICIIGQDTQTSYYYRVYDRAGSSTAQAKIHIEYTIGVSSSIPVFTRGLDSQAVSQSAFLVGGVEDKQSAYLYGEEDLTTSQSALAIGGLIVSTNQGAYLKGGVGSSTPAHTWGKTTGSGSQSAFLYNGTWVYGNQSAYTKGLSPFNIDLFNSGLNTFDISFEDLDHVNASQSAYMDTDATNSSSQPAFLVGGIVSSSNTYAFAQGTGTIKWQDAYLKGRDTTSGSQSVYLDGGVTATGSQSAFLMTWGGSSTSAYATGIGILSGSISGYTIGWSIDSESQGAYLSGHIAASSSQKAFCNSGKLTATSKQKAYLSADRKSSQKAYLEGESTVYDYIVLSTPTSSTSLRFAIYAADYADTMYETGRIVNRTIPGGVDITSGTLRRKWSPIIRVLFTEPRAGYGTVSELEDLYKVDGPILWKDHYGQEYNAIITGDFQKSIKGVAIEGEGSIFMIKLDLLEVI
jgi:hypothetical protein